MLEVHRTHVYDLRKRLLTAELEGVRGYIKKCIRLTVDDLMDKYCNLQRPPKDWKIVGVMNELKKLTVNFEKMLMQMSAEATQENQKVKKFTEEIVQRSPFLHGVGLPPCISHLWQP